MVTHQSVLTSISDFFLSSKVVTMQQTDSAAHKLKPRSFHKSAYLRVYSVDFHPSVNHAWHGLSNSTISKIANLPIIFSTSDWTIVSIWTSMSLY